MDEAPEGDFINGADDFFGVVDPLGLAPFSKEIEQVGHRELTGEEIKEQRERDLMFDRGEF
jgi:hypothetical protein